MKNPLTAHRASLWALALVTGVAQTLPAWSQVTVGYSTLTSVVGSSIRDQSYRQRTTDQYEAAGVNVEPIDGSNTFNRKTIWKIYDEEQSWSLSIVDSDPRVDVSKQDSSTRLVQAGRKESVYATISGPLYGTIRRTTLSPFSSVILPPIIPVSTSVFPEEFGGGQKKNRDLDLTN